MIAVDTFRYFSYLSSVWLNEPFLIYFTEVFALDNNPNQITHWKFQIFSRIIGVDWPLIYEDCFRIKSTENLKSKYKHRSDYYLGQALGG